MSPWKVILATVAIFVAGLLTGAVGVSRLVKAPRPSLRADPLQPWMLRENFRRELDRRLELTDEQNARIENIMHEGQERIREIWSLVGPEIQAEMRAVREEISRELTPEQRRKFEQLMRDRKPRPLQLERPPIRPPFRDGPPRDEHSVPRDSER